MRVEVHVLCNNDFFLVSKHVHVRAEMYFGRNVQGPSTGRGVIGYWVGRVFYVMTGDV